MAEAHAWHWGKPGSAPPSLPDAVIPACEYGTAKEDSGVATLTRHELSRLGKDVQVFEAGMHRLMGDLDFVAVTPDGICRVGDKLIAIEVKCPFFGKTGQSPESDAACRPYYILQVHAEMAAIGAKRGFLISWDVHTSVIFEIDFDETLWGLVTAWLKKWWVAVEAPTPCQETIAISDRCKEVALRATNSKKVVASIKATPGV